MDGVCTRPLHPASTFSSTAFRTGEKPPRGETWRWLAESWATGRAIIKRVVGAPGDTVLLDRGVLTVNGVSPDSAASLEDVDPRESGEWNLGDDEYFLLGDAWEFSTDSRSFGPVARSAIKGRAWLVYRPVSRWRRLGKGG